MEIQTKIQNNIHENNIINHPSLSTLTKHKHLGNVVYSGPYSTIPSSLEFEHLSLFLLPSFTSLDHYSTINVRIPAQFLLFQSNLAIRSRALWGSGIYSDDSDIFAILVHSGLYTPIDYTLNHNWQLDPPLLSQQLPDHDLQVTLCILPRLENYKGSFSYISSRSWGLHDGHSIKIESVTKLKRGSVLSQGRKSASKEWVQEVAALKQNSIKFSMPFDGKIWINYTPRVMELQQWNSKFTSSNCILVFTGENDILWELSMNQGKYTLKKNGKTIGFAGSVEWSEKGLKFVDREFLICRFCWMK